MVAGGGHTEMECSETPPPAAVHWQPVRREILRAAKASQVAEEESAFEEMGSASPPVLTLDGICRVRARLSVGTPRAADPRFRRRNVCLVDRFPPGGYRYDPPHWRAVPAALENLCARLRALLDTGVCPILVAALMHHGIAAVHPFLNGNGRTSRVAASLAAVAAPDACRVRFSAVFGSDPERYYEVVRRSFLRPDRLPEWIAFLAESTSGSVDPVDLGCGAAGSCGHRFSVPEVVAEYGTFLEEMEALARASAPDDHRRP